VAPQGSDRIHTRSFRPAQQSLYRAEWIKGTAMQMHNEASAVPFEKPGTPGSSVWAWTALLVAVLTAAGSLALSMVDKKQACPLCFYQRTFALSLVAVLGQGLLTGTVRSGRLAILALPLAIGGLGVAAFHVSLEVHNILECPSGLFDISTAPKQSLAAFAVLTILLLAGVASGLKAREVSFPGTVLALALGGGLVWGSLTANPKLPEPPTKPYSAPLTVCRPPYQGP
jgi:disulfide bond formation protein DsbB